MKRVCYKNTEFYIYLFYLLLKSFYKGIKHSLTFLLIKVFHLDSFDKVA